MKRKFLYTYDMSGSLYDFETLEKLINLPVVKREIEALPPTPEEKELHDKTKRRSLAAWEKMKKELKKDLESSADWWKDDAEDWKGESKENGVPIVDASGIIDGIRLLPPHDDDYRHRTMGTFVELGQSDPFRISDKCIPYHVERLREDGIQNESLENWCKLTAEWLLDNGHIINVYLGYFSGGQLGGLAKFPF